MKKYSFIFPGQGSQSVGMSSCLLSNSISKSYFSETSDILGYDLMDICLNGPDVILTKTLNTQPSIFTISVIIDTILKDNNIHPYAVAGHSLGEYSAIVSSGSLTFTEAVKLIIIRAKEMERANKINHGSMAAIINANNTEINEILECTNGVLVVANYNSEHQIVISGEKSAVISAIEFSKKLSKKIRCVELNVSGAFHSPLMSFAREALSNAINSLNFNDAEVPIYQNINPLPTVKAMEIKNNLILQLENPVKWHHTIKNMIDRENTDAFLECGPGNVLTGINKRISREIVSLAINNQSTIESICTKN